MLGKHTWCSDNIAMTQEAKMSEGKAWSKAHDKLNGQDPQICGLIDTINAGEFFIDSRLAL
jgi:hypothetical protein